MRPWLNIALILVFVLVTIFLSSSSLNESKFRILDWLSFGSRPASNLELENERLKGELMMLKVDSTEAVADNLAAVLEINSILKSENFIPANIYLNYPFAHKDKFLIDVGQDANLLVSWPVVSNGFLVGFVDAVYPSKSSIKTLFSDDLSLKVLVVSSTGKRMPALFKGGLSPKLELADKMISIDDRVINADDRLPFGWPIGLVESVVQQSGDNYVNAQIHLDESFLNTNQVLIYSKFTP